uniref:Protein Churchill n=1 Tax=Aotus nancymaae TaxID=37293 RepID=A0A2K5E1K5_AOTNA
MRSREVSSSRKRWRTFPVDCVAMCGDCVEKEYPNRVSDSALLWPVTHICIVIDFFLQRHHSYSVGEKIVFNKSSDLCKNCHHVIARHEYTFSIMDEFQEYTMLCLLCGKAEDTISILPDDPRQMTLLF